MNVPVRSLYIHIPFCGSKCFYCDFNSYVSSETVMERYTDALCKELTMIAQTDSALPLRTVFFGGGTPTLLPPRLLEKILQTLHQFYSIEADAEITMEANPGSVDSDTLRIIKEHGVNRLSFGVQSFDDTMLHSLGRLHDRNTVYRSFEMARKAGFYSINLDLMFGLPDQTLELLEDSVSQLLMLAPEHVSVYGLKIEAGTPFAKWYDAGHLQLPPEHAEVAMYEFVQQSLADHGYEQYEISNFAKHGHKSRHNIVYWRNEPYLAAGAGAHGYVGGRRYANIKRLDPYMEELEAEKRPIESVESISVEMEQEDTMMLGLRLAEGVTYDRFFTRHGVAMQEVFGSVIQDFAGKGLLEVDESGVRLRRSAYIVGNEVFAGFIDI
ncbi:radical SAM family heme chaperone HemW [Fodinisporobacter ferrooxydans]|uniref:Heme chaperone HemW n=1 Tax=Fodinisporobacter ferrooxydans TaxID=2901836 RepID=A0ABY4CEK4_9BACL|nr:radical SAM family heme chaperone HemW [Alicyclobacillaceae bacterium MYW30-H2]